METITLWSTDAEAAGIEAARLAAEFPGEPIRVVELRGHPDRALAFLVRHPEAFMPPVSVVRAGKLRIRAPR